MCRLSLKFVICSYYHRVVLMFVNRTESEIESITAKDGSIFLLDTQSEVPELPLDSSHHSDRGVAGIGAEDIPSSEFSTLGDHSEETGAHYANFFSHHKGRVTNTYKGEFHGCLINCLGWMKYGTILRWLNRNLL